MRPILEEMSQPAGWLLLTLQALCREQNGGVIQGVVTVPKTELERITRYWYPKLDHRLHELEQLGLLVRDKRGRLILTESRRPWLRKSEPPERTVPSLGGTKSTNGVTPPLRSRESNSTDKNTVTLNTVSLNTEQRDTEYCTTDVRAVKLNFTSVSPEVVSLVHGALRKMGISPPSGSAFVKGARNLAAKRLREGHTVKELSKVVQWAMTRWIQGDHFPALKQFNYLWGQNLPSHIAATKSGVGGGAWDQPEKVFTNVIVDDKESPGGERPGTDRSVPSSDEQSY